MITAARAKILSAPAPKPDALANALGRASDRLGVYRGEQVSHPVTLTVADRDGTNERALPGAFSDFNPSWSPDGTRIAAVNDLGSIARVVVVDPDGVAEPIQISTVLPADGVIADRAVPVMWQRVAP